MLIHFFVLLALTSRIRPLTVLHVGAHLGEEASTYGLLRASEVHWVESQSRLANELRSSLDPSKNSVYHATVWSEDDLELTFYETNNSQSSSVLPMKLHLVEHPHIVQARSYRVKTNRLDSILPDKKFDLINMDIQGAEYPALIGLGKLLRTAKVLYLEVNKREMYEGVIHVSELDHWLKQQGFSRVITKWPHRRGWGDAIYVTPALRARIPLAILIFWVLEPMNIIKRIVKLIRKRLLNRHAFYPGLSEEQEDSL